MGYELSQLTREVDALPLTARSLLGDAGGLALDLAKEPVRVRIRRRGKGGPNAVRALLAQRPSRTPGLGAATSTRRRSGDVAGGSDDERVATATREGARVAAAA
jgi:hypothetical protein